MTDIAIQLAMTAATEFILIEFALHQSAQPLKNHGQYVSCMTKAAQSFAADGVISDNEKSDLVNAEHRVSVVIN